MSGNWIAVACAAHVRRGQSEGFMQVCHGKAAPLRRLSPGDRVVYYAPTESFGGSDRLQAFTAIGVVRDGEPYAAAMGDFRPFRRDVAWLEAAPAPLAALRERLAFTSRPGWGWQLRRGMVAIDAADMAIIAAAMGATLPDRTAACGAAPHRAG
jgi:hypothetical protein